MEETLKELDMNHVITSYYCPQAKSKVERFQRTLHGIIAKKITDNTQTWDIHLNHVHLNKSLFHNATLYTTEMSCCLLIFSETRRRYAPEDQFKIVPQVQLNVFILVQPEPLERAIQFKQGERKQSTDKEDTSQAPLQ